MRDEDITSKNVQAAHLIRLCAFKSYLKYDRHQPHFENWHAWKFPEHEFTLLLQKMGNGDTRFPHTLSNCLPLSPRSGE